MPTVTPFPLLLLLLCVLSCVVRKGEAADAACSDPRYSDFTNTLGQDPCKVASNILNSCPGTDGTPIGALQAGYIYSGFDAVYESACVCNTVYYSELAVCALCQGGGIEVWPTWNANCTKTFGTLPGAIPANTNIQSWAYLPLLANGTLDVDAVVAEVISGGSEASGPTSIQSTVSATSSATSPSSMHAVPTKSASASPSASSTPSVVPESSGAPVGAIAGGVVGGVAALVALGLVLFFVCRRRRRDQRRQDAFEGTTIGGDGSVHGEKPPLETLGSSQITPFYSPQTPYSPNSPPLSPYDPDAPYDPRAAYNTDVTSNGSSTPGAINVSSPPGPSVHNGSSQFAAPTASQFAAPPQAGGGSQFAVYTPQGAPGGEGQRYSVTNQAGYSGTNQAGGGGGGVSGPRYPEVMQ